MKYTFSFLICLLNSLNLDGQSNLIDLAQNEMKYWKLRGRLIGDESNRDSYNGFISIGLGPGQSLPAVQRHPTYKRNSHDFDTIHFFLEYAVHYKL